MSFLIETDVLAGARRRDKADPALATWLNACEPGRAYLSALTIFELEQCCETLLRKDLRKGAMFRLWLNRHVMPQFEGRILPLDSGIARFAASLQANQPRAERESLIAATALVHKFSIVTGNPKGFAGTGAKIINPWAM